MLRPARGYVLIEPIQDTEKTSAGVYLPEQAKDKPMKGKVVDLGNTIPIDGTIWISEIEKGDIVYYKKWGNEEVKEDGKEYIFVKFEDILGVYEPD